MKKTLEKQQSIKRGDIDNKIYSIRRYINGRNKSYKKVTKLQISYVIADYIAILRHNIILGFKTWIPVIGNVQVRLHELKNGKMPHILKSKLYMEGKKELAYNTHTPGMYASTDCVDGICPKYGMTFKPGAKMRKEIHQRLMKGEKYEIVKD